MLGSGEWIAWGRIDDDPGLAVLIGEGGAQDLMALEDAANGRGKRLNIEWPGEFKI